MLNSRLFFVEEINNPVKKNRALNSINYFDIIIFSESKKVSVKFNVNFRETLDLARKTSKVIRHK